jgi:hypothetical protein
MTNLSQSIKNNNELTAAQVALIALQSESGRDAMVAAIAAGVFYADAVRVDGYTIPSTEYHGVNAPLLYATAKEAELEIAEEVARYKDDIDNGDREEDDEYEGGLVKVTAVLCFLS